VTSDHYHAELLLTQTQSTWPACVLCPGVCVGGCGCGCVGVCPAGAPVQGRRYGVGTLCEVVRWRAGGSAETSSSIR
jgi:hypothetical protein